MHISTVCEKGRERSKYRLICVVFAQIALIAVYPNVALYNIITFDTDSQDLFDISYISICFAQRCILA